jgi:hypothetical protein
MMRLIIPFRQHFMTISKTMRLAEDLEVHIDYTRSHDYSRLNPEKQKDPDNFAGVLLIP